MADNITVKDAGGANTVLASTNTAGIHTPHYKVTSIAAGASVDLGAVNDAAWNGTANSSLIGIAKANAANASLIVINTSNAAALISAMSAKLPASLGSKSAANSTSFTLSVENIATISAIATEATLEAIRLIALDIKTAAQTTANSVANTSAAAVYSSGREYEPVAASAPAQALGATGALGDDLDHIVVIPASLSPGAVSIKDGTDTAITVFTGGANSVLTLIPFAIPLSLKSRTGAWQITTGTNVSVLASGNFT